MRNRVGFFLHIPWPAYQVVINLPRHRRLVEALFDYDLVGFQTQDYLQAFEEYVLNEAGGAALAPGLLRGFGPVLRVGVFPVGIDAAAFARVAGSPAAEAMRQRMLAATSPRRLIIGVDRLDYSKGMEERFLGFEQFLAHNADLRRDILMLQIAPVSRDAVQAYQEIRSRLDALSGRINGEYSDVDWAPLRYVNHTYGRDELAGIYAAARVGLVTPLRDGMNLVAKEFVSAQDPEDPGVLILSRFAGAARQGHIEQVGIGLDVLKSCLEELDLLRSAAARAGERFSSISRRGRLKRRNEDSGGRGPAQCPARAAPWDARASDASAHKPRRHRTWRP